MFIREVQLDTDRFQIVRQLGAGGTGVVYEAMDHHRGHSVALKVLHEGNPERVYRFKASFRHLRAVSHPNLVALYDLFVDGDCCYYTMECIRGTDFLSWCRRGDPQARVRRLLPALVAGVLALHRLGKVHRDIKPSNVVVTESAALYLLDYGLVEDVENLTDTQTNLPGTAAYMSPEQCRVDGEVTFATDWYAVGVMLFQALTGRLPFEGAPHEVVANKLAREAPDVADFVPGMAPDLRTMCARLLERNPRERGRADDLLHCVAGPPEDGGREVVPISPLLGRVPELRLLEAQLDQMREGNTTVSVIAGGSGIGKTALVSAAIDRAKATDPSLVVLRARCYRSESVPFSAMDAIVDQLSEVWRRLRSSEAAQLVPSQPGPLQTLFPVLRRVPALAEHAESRGPVDLRQKRKAARNALRETLQRLGRLRRVVVFVDDLQWIDRDSLWLIAELLRFPDPPALMVLFASREDDPDGVDLAETIDIPIQHVALGPLALETCRRLALRLLATRTTRARDEMDSLASEIALGSEGSPFFVEMFVEHHVRQVTRTPVGLAEVILGVSQRLSDSERGLLHAICVASEPIHRGAALLATDLSADDGERALRRLVSMRLVASSSTHDSHVSPYHDRIREAIGEHLSASTTRRLRLMLARALVRLDGRAEQIARLLQDAGSATEAWPHALRAARAADAALDFGKAAELYQSCLTGGAEIPAAARLDILRSLARALSHAARFDEAAELFLQLAGLADDETTSFDARKAAGEQFIRAGQLDRGLGMFGGLLGHRADRNLEKPLLGNGAQLARDGTRRIAPEELRLMDLFSSFMLALLYTDPARCLQFADRHLALARDAGEPVSLARAMALEGAVRAIGPRSSPVEIDSPMLRAKELLFFNQVDPKVECFTLLCEGMMHLLAGKWRLGMMASHEADQLATEKCTEAAWEITMARFGATCGARFVGQLDGLKEVTFTSYFEARERSDYHRMAVVGTGHGTLAWLSDDRPDLARRALDECSAFMAGSEGYTITDFLVLLGEGEWSLYVGEAARGYDVLSSQAARFASSGFSRIQLFRAQLADLRGRLALAKLASGTEPAESEQAVQEAIAQLHAEGKSWTSGLAHLLSGCLAVVRGDSRGAFREYQRANPLLEASSMVLHMSCIYWRLAEVGDGRPHRRVVDAREWLTERGVKDPDRFVRVITPT